MSNEIRLLQFLVCKDFKEQGRDAYQADAVQSNIIVPQFPYSFEHLYVVTCWRKDKRFHKEVIEYVTSDGVEVKSAHMDIEPVTDSVYFRWHKHHFPAELVVDKTSLLTIRVILDWKVHWETYLMVEKP